MCCLSVLPRLVGVSCNIQHLNYILNSETHLAPNISGKGLWINVY